ncbi:pollen-specific leucine-rich repeat extensin-like protein 4 [Iris pallida]|uniref:Pollen-specific leucine-rich repeat extensin-like protein 4 n=1 Tax=Iris pallida TaxID=29817 RepID=A0AAX6FR42_IRIPA|nr:pollen-specific leucine-rich repeat extensin-like protein 4 [Iris pallida]
MCFHPPIILLSSGSRPPARITTPPPPPSDPRPHPPPSLFPASSPPQHQNTPPPPPSDPRPHPPPSLFPAFSPPHHQNTPSPRLPLAAGSGRQPRNSRAPQPMPVPTGVSLASSSRRALSLPAQPIADRRAPASASYPGQRVCARPVESLRSRRRTSPPSAVQRAPQRRQSSSAPGEPLVPPSERILGDAALTNPGSVVIPRLLVR